MSNIGELGERLGGIEAGGTKFVCGVCDSASPCETLIREEFRTTTPDETLAMATGFFSRHPVAALGIGCFGPVDLRRGTITTTPKPGWQNVAIVDRLRTSTGIQGITFDTDVNAAAMGEYTWGAAQGVNTFIYLTVGTGIGGGVMMNGQLLHGLSHPEMGHIRIPHDRIADNFAGDCYAHGDCLEGLASGAAIKRRWKRSGEELPPDHPAWDLEANYLALALMTFTCALSPQKVIIGGGVMNQVGFPVVREKLSALLNNYTAAPEVVPPGLGANSGLLGAISLAGRLLNSRHSPIAPPADHSDLG